MNLRTQAFILLLLLAHHSFEIDCQATPIVIQNPSGAFLDPLDLPLPWIFFDSSNLLTSLDPRALVQNRNLFEQFPKYLTPQFPGNAQNFPSGVATLVGEALVKLATGYIAENVLKTGTTFLRNQNAAWTTAWTDSVDEMRQCIGRVNQGQVASLEQDIQTISTNLANSINSDELTDEENSIIFHLWNSVTLESFKDAARKNKTVIEMFANMTAQIIAVPYSIEYQNILSAQFETKDSASAKGSAAQMFAQVSQYQRELAFKQAYNFYTYLSKKSQLNGPEEIVYSFTVSQEDDSLFHITTFNASNLDKNQWRDLVSQVNHTIINYLTAQNILFLSSTPYTYTYLEFDQEIEFIPNLLENGNVNRFFRIKLTNFTEAPRNEFLAQIKQTIEGTFSLSVRPDIPRLLTSIRDTLLNKRVSDGIRASFKTIQTERNFYKVSFDASDSYDLWAGSLICSWDFGDGTAILRGVNLFNTAHVYDQAGNYTVTLKVQDFYGHSILAKSLSPVIILFNRPPTALKDIGLCYIAGKTQGWMFLDGNSYYTIPFVNGASQATLFALENKGADTWIINARGVNGEIINNYLGSWGYPANSTATLQASFLPERVWIPAHVSFKILPIASEPGYWTIQNTTGFYLTITGEFQTKYEPNLCDFTFTSGAQESQAQLTMRLREAGSQTLPDLEFINQVNNGQVKVMSTSTDSLLDFFPYQNTGYYSIANYRDKSRLLTSRGISTAVSFETTNTPTDKHLWSVLTISDTSVILASKQNSQLCLNYTGGNNIIALSNCPSVNDSCHDRVGRFINKPTCQIQQDQYCCDASLISLSSSEKKRYYDSCKTCSSGKYYCSSSKDRNNVFIENPNFNNEKCEPERNNLSPSFKWYFNRIDPATAQRNFLNQLSTYVLSLRNIKIYNVGYGKYLCQDGVTYPILCDQPTRFNILTFNGLSDLGNPNSKNVGVVIVGTGSNSEKYISGPYDRSSNLVFSVGNALETHGHYWYLDPRGYNMIKMKYGWGLSSPLCMTATSDDVRAKGTYEGKILMSFQACGRFDRGQEWSYSY